MIPATDAIWIQDLPVRVSTDPDHPYRTTDVRNGGRWLLKTVDGRELWAHFSSLSVDLSDPVVVERLRALEEDASCVNHPDYVSRVVQAELGLGPAERGAIASARGSWYFGIGGRWWGPRSTRASAQQAVDDVIETVPDPVKPSRPVIDEAVEVRVVADRRVVAVYGCTEKRVTELLVSWLGPVVVQVSGSDSTRGTIRFDPDTSVTVFAPARLWYDVLTELGAKP